METGTPALFPFHSGTRGTPKRLYAAHPFPLRGGVGGGRPPKISSSSREVIGRMTCQNNGGLSYFPAPSEAPKVSVTRRVSFPPQLGPSRMTLGWGAGCGPRHRGSAVSACQPHTRGFEPPDISPALRTLPRNSVTTLTSSQPAISPGPPPGRSAMPGCPWAHTTGHWRWAIKENCGRAAWCQGASQPPRKKAAP